MTRTVATDATANHLLDHLASDGKGGAWTYYTDLAGWESLYNLRGERYFVGRLARIMAARGLAQTRRATMGMQLRLTPTGIALAEERGRQAADAAATVDWSAITFECRGDPMPSEIFTTDQAFSAGRV